jgi:hypothetical protein
MVMKERADTARSTPAAETHETLHRSLSLWNSLTIGFATLSPIGSGHSRLGCEGYERGG